VNGLIAALRLLAASQVLLFACVLMTPGSAAKLRVPGLALTACVIAYLLIPLTAPYLGAAVAVAGLLANAIPAALFWFTWAVFEDRPRLPRTFVVAASAYLATVLLLWPSGTPGGPPVVIGVVVQSFKLGFAVAAIVLIWRGRHVDLVERRLQLRRVFVAGIAIMVALVVTTELVSNWNVPLALELIGMAGIFGLALALNLAFVRPGTLLSKPASLPVVPETGAQTEDPLIAALLRSMCEDRLYADHDLRIATLAARLGVPEYRLRRTINQQLGFRNFNQFVNGFRIDEAAQRLKTERELPILTIALDVGFRSVSSFNTAFRERFGMAPSEYRASDPTKN
jgi:AraC-like DNA-binding protein